MCHQTAVDLEGTLNSALKRIEKWVARGFRFVGPKPKNLPAVLYQHLDCVHQADVRWLQVVERGEADEASEGILDQLFVCTSEGNFVFNIMAGEELDAFLQTVPIQPELAAIIAVRMALLACVTQIKAIFGNAKAEELEQIPWCYVCKLQAEQPTWNPLYRFFSIPVAPEPAPVVSRKISALCLPLEEQKEEPS